MTTPATPLQVIADGLPGTDVERDYAARELLAALGEAGYQVVSYIDPATWTIGPDGHTNTSPAFMDLVAAVKGVLLSEGDHLVAGRVGEVAGLIVAQLAHRHGLAPTQAVTA